MYAAQYQNTNNPTKKWAEDLDRHFSKDNTQIANKHMKRCLTSLIMRQMQIETTVRCHIPPVKWLSSKKSTNKKCWRECREKGKLLLCWWEYKLIQPLWRIVWMLLKKLWTKLSYYQQIPWLGLYPKKTIIQKDTCTLLFIVVLFTRARTW